MHYSWAVRQTLSILHSHQTTDYYLQGIKITLPADRLSKGLLLMAEDRY